MRLFHSNCGCSSFQAPHYFLHTDNWVVMTLCSKAVTTCLTHVSTMLKGLSPLLMLRSLAVKAVHITQKSYSGCVVTTSWKLTIHQACFVWLDKTRKRKGSCNFQSALESIHLPLDTDFSFFAFTANCHKMLNSNIVLLRCNCAHIQLQFSSFSWSDKKVVAWFCFSKTEYWFTNSTFSVPFSVGCSS